MTQELDAIDFIGELGKSIGVSIAVGKNVFLEQPDKTNLYSVIIDPSSLSNDDESKLERYAESQRLRVNECWNDWGRFLRVSKPRTIQYTTP
jgi:hypothetical protein